MSDCGLEVMRIGASVIATGDHLMSSLANGDCGGSSHRSPIVVGYPPAPKDRDAGCSCMHSQPSPIRANPKLASLPDGDIKGVACPGQSTINPKL